MSKLMDKYQEYRASLDDMKRFTKDASNASTMALFCIVAVCILMIVVPTYFAKRDRQRALEREATFVPRDDPYWAPTDTQRWDQAATVRGDTNRWEPPAATQELTAATSQWTKADAESAELRRWTAAVGLAVDDMQSSTACVLSVSDRVERLGKEGEICKVYGHQYGVFIEGHKLGMSCKVCGALYIPSADIPPTMSPDDLQ